MGPDLEYLAGYAAPALERLTALIVRPGAPPVLIVPELERPRAEEAPGRRDCSRWWVGRTATTRTGTSSRVLGASPARARRWEPAVVGPPARARRRCCPATAFEAAAPVLATLRARKDAGEIALLAAAGAAADAAFAPW